MGEDPAATPTADSQRPFASPSASSEKAVLAPLTLSPGSRQAERSYCPTRGREAHPGRRRAARGHTMAEAEPDQNFLAASARVSLGASAGRMLRSPENLVTSAQPGASPIPTLAGREQPPLPFSAPPPHAFVHSLCLRTPHTPLPQGLAGGRSSLCSPRTEPAGHQRRARGTGRTRCSAGGGGWLGGLGQEAQPKRAETKPNRTPGGR